MYYDHFHKDKISNIGQAITQIFNRWVSRRILRYFAGKPIKILEVGHGRGDFAEILRHEGRERMNYFGIEPNESLCHKGEEKGFTIANTKIPPFPDGPEWKNFDCVYVSHVLEHFADYETVMRVLTDMHKLLTPDGILVIIFPDYLDYKADFFTTDYSHNYIIDKRRMKNLLIDSGFLAVSVRSFRGCVLSPWHSLLFPLHFVIRLLSGALYHLTGKEAFFKAKITLGRNVYVLAKKRDTSKSDAA